MKLMHYFLHITLQHERNKRKKKGALLGQQFFVPRQGKRRVETYLYRPAKSVLPVPVMFNVHGGGWVGCDATWLDSQSQYLAEELSCFVVNINCTKPLAWRLF